MLAHLGGGGANLASVRLPEAVAAGINEFEHLVGLETAWREVCERFCGVRMPLWCANAAIY